MFASFLQGIFGKLLPLAAIIVGITLIAHDLPGTGVSTIAVGGFFGAFLRYLSRHTVRVRP